MRFTPVVLVFAAILLFFFYVDPTYKDVQSKLEQQNQLEKSYADAQELQKISKEKKGEFNDLSATGKERLAVMVSDNPDETRLFNNIDGIGNRNGLTLTQVQLSTGSAGQQRGATQAVEADNGLQEVSISFMAQANFTNFISFLEDVEKSLQLMDVTQIEISPTGNDVGSLYQYTVNLTAYSL